MQKQKNHKNRKNKISTKVSKIYTNKTKQEEFLDNIIYFQKLYFRWFPRTAHTYKYARERILYYRHKQSLLSSLSQPVIII